MADDPELGRILGVEAFHAGEVVGDLGSTLTETHDAVVQEGTGVTIWGVRIAESCGMEEEGEKQDKCWHTSAGQHSNRDVTPQA